MDRSRAAVALALGLATVSLLLGLLQIGMARKSQDFTTPAGALFNAGKAGIALIEVRGVIEDGSGGPGGQGADRIVERIRSAQEDPAVRGMLLSINSPGGTTGATKKIYDKLIEFRKEKPIVCYVTDIAASGGYYLCSAANKIYAYRGSIIGSIGVIMIHPDAEELLRKVGLTVSVIKAGRFKDMSYPFRTMTEEERLMNQKLVDDAYEQFVRDVAEGRRQPETNVRKWAEGKIYSGTSAKAEQIIDEFGGETEALLSMTTESIKTKDDLPLLRPRKEFFEEFLTGLSGRSYDLSSGRVYYLYPDSTTVARMILGPDLVKIAK